jgi:hypothetical protein
MDEFDVAFHEIFPSPVDFGPPQPQEPVRSNPALQSFRKSIGSPPCSALHTGAAAACQRARLVGKNSACPLIPQQSHLRIKMRLRAREIGALRSLLLLTYKCCDRCPWQCPLRTWRAARRTLRTQAPGKGRSFARDRRRDASD